MNTDIISFLKIKYREVNSYCTCVKLVMDKYNITEKHAVTQVCNFIDIRNKEKNNRRIKKAVLI